MNGLNFVVLHVDNVAGAKTFFTEKIGMVVDNEAPGFVQFKAPDGGATFALSTQDPAAPAQPVELWWFVADVDAEHARLVEHGVLERFRTLTYPRLTVTTTEAGGGATRPTI